MSDHRTAEEIEESIKYSTGYLKECNRCKKIVGAYVEADGLSHCISCITFFCNKNYDTIQELLKQLQAETQRADKAEEMVVGLVKNLQDVLRVAKNDLNDNTNPQVLENALDILFSVAGQGKDYEQAFRQKLCDEIVGKIEGQQQFLFKKDDPAFVQDYDCGKQVAWNFAIDIVKSVLKVEG